MSLREGGYVRKRKQNKDPEGSLPKERYPVEDRVLKDAAWFLGKELLPLLGVEGKLRRAAPTEAVFLEISDFLADFNYEMEDGTWKHLEFESDRISTADLRRFRACEAVISYRYGGFHICAVHVKDKGSQKPDVTGIQCIPCGDHPHEGLQCR